MAKAGTNVFPINTDFHGVVDEGSYFCVQGAQTGIATAAAPTAFSDTNPFLSIFNKDTVKSIYLDFIALMVTAAGTNGTQLFAAAQIDLNTDRYTSGGTDLTANIANPNGNAPNVSSAKFRAGNITAAAKSSVARQLVGNRVLRGSIPVVNDTYIIKFGAVDSPAALGVSTVGMVLQNVPKIVIPPQGSFLLHLWLPAQSVASSYIPEAGWVER